jgi:hypothetical protein
MAERMAWLLDHPAKAVAMGAAGRKKVAERFSDEKALDGLRASLDLPPHGA